MNFVVRVIHDGRLLIQLFRVTGEIVAPLIGRDIRYPILICIVLTGVGRGEPVLLCPSVVKGAVVDNRGRDGSLAHEFWSL